MATNYSLYRDDTISFAPSDLKPTLQELLKKLPTPNEGFLSDSMWTKTKSKQWVIKCSVENLTHIKNNISGTEQGDAYNTVIAGYKVQFRRSGKKSAGGAVSDAKTTLAQELGSAFIMRRAIADNMIYSKYQDIIEDTEFQKWKMKHYPECDEEWVKTYFAQQKKMLEEFSKKSFTEFNVKGGFMDFITNILKTKYGVAKKDTWNPADIWLLKDEKSVIADIKKVLDNGAVPLSELNELLRTMFKQRRVVGISLKKVSGKEAKYEEVNVNSGDFIDVKHYNYNVSAIKIDLTVKNGKFNTQDCRILVNTGGDYGIINFQIKANTSTAISNLKYEPTATGASSARIGKAPVDMVTRLLKEPHYKLSFNNDNKLFPKSSKEFIKDKDKYIKMFSSLKTNPLVNFGGSLSEQDFVNNMISVLDSNLFFVANSKLMQLTFLYEINKLKKEQLDYFMTDFTFLCMKKGSNFGPFGKLY